MFFKQLSTRDASLSRAAFVEQLCAEIPPRPADMQRIVAANVAA